MDRQAGFIPTFLTTLISMTLTIIVSNTLAHLIHNAVKELSPGLLRGGELSGRPQPTLHFWVALT